MKLSYKEQVGFLTVLTVALAVPISLLVLNQEQDRRIRASGLDVVVVSNFSECPSDKVAHVTCFDAINSAIAAATTQSGSTVTIKAGTYDQQAAIGGSNVIDITILGEGEGVTIIKDTSNVLKNGHPFQIDNPNATIRFQNMTIDGTSGDSSIHIYRAKRVEIYNVEVKNSPTAGIYFSGNTTGLVSNCNLHHNYWPGVSLHENANIEVDNCVFKNHQHAGLDATDNAKVVVSNSEFFGNNTIDEDDTRGQIRTIGSSKLICRNSSIHDGGNHGVVSADSSLVEVSNSRIQHNLSVGVFLKGTKKCSVNNNIITKNGYGGVGGMNAIDAMITNNTIDDNERGGIYLYNSEGGGPGSIPTVTVRNNIITNNKTPTEGVWAGIGGDFFGTAGYLDGSQFEYNLIWNNVGDNTDCGNRELCISDPKNKNAIAVDPKFVTDGSYRLASGSPAINAGSTDSKYDDPNGSRNDMGAWGGPMADWGLSGGVNKVDCDAKTITGTIKDWNDLNRSYAGYLGEIWIKEGSTWKSFKKLSMHGKSNNNFSVAIPESLIDGQSHDLKLMGYNVAPVEDFNGNRSVVRQTNTFGVSMDKTLSVFTVRCDAPPPPNNPPVFQEALEDIGAIEGQYFNYAIQVSDPDGDVLTADVTTPDELKWMNSTFDGSTIHLSGTPEKGAEIGTFEVTLTISDGKDPVTGNINIKVEEAPVTTPILNLRIDLEFKEDDSNSAIDVKVFDNSDNQVYQTITSSNADGLVGAISLDGVEPADYKIWVKPKGYLAQKLDVALVTGENKITMPEEFLAGDLHEGNTYNIVKAADYSFLIMKYFEEDELRNLDGDPFVNAKDLSVMFKNWFVEGAPYK